MTTTALATVTVPDTQRTNLVRETAVEYPVPFSDCRIVDAVHSLLPGVPSGSYLAHVGGTFASDTPKLASSDSGGTTITQKCRFFPVLPAEYDAEQTIKVRIVGKMDAAADTATIDVNCYKHNEQGGVGTDLCQTNAQNLTATLTTFDFEINSSGLQRGQVLDVVVTVTATSASGSGKTANIVRFRMVYDIKG